MGLFATKQREQPVMASKTDEQIAKENRLRLFRPDGARAMEDAADEAVVVRKNMERVPIVNPIRWQLIENRAMLLLDV
jgi:hypothetical protein